MAHPRVQESTLYGIHQPLENSHPSGRRWAQLQVEADLSHHDGCWASALFGEPAIQAGRAAFQQISHRVGVQHQLHGQPRSCAVPSSRSTSRSTQICSRMPGSCRSASRCCNQVRADAVGVEDAHQKDLGPVHALVVETQGSAKRLPLSWQERRPIVFTQPR